MMLMLLAAIPLIGAVVVGALGSGMAPYTRPKVIAIGFSLVALGVAVIALTAYDFRDGGYQLTHESTWIEAFGAQLAFGVNGIGVVMVMLTAVLTPLVLLAASGDRLERPERMSTYLSLILVTEGLALAAFSAADAFLFYVLFEATLVPLYFLIGSFGGPNRSYAAVKFLVYNLIGGLLMLAAIVGLYVVSAREGQPSYLISDLTQLQMSDGTQKLLFLGFMAAFAVKAPMFPFHTWLPDAAAQATPATSVMMVSVLDKLGTFGMLVWCLAIFPDAARWAAPVIIALAVVGIIYGALVAMGQQDLRRLVAFTSVSHFGFIVMGIFAFTTTAMSGATLYMFNHGLSTAALFLVTGVMIARRGSAGIGDFGGVQKIAPIMSGFLLVAGLSSLSLPGLAPFVSEFMVLAGTFTRSVPAAVLATSGIVLAALYILIMYQRTMTGPLTEGGRGVTELNAREKSVLTPMVVLIVGLGFFPQPLLNVINPAIDTVASRVGVGDPPPKTPVQLDRPASDAADAEGGH